MEANLAETSSTSSKNSLWITIGAGLATVLVVVGIAVGPTAVNCFSSESGFGGCMQDRLAETGLLGPQSETVAPPTEIAAEVRELEPVPDEEAAPVTDAGLTAVAETDSAATETDNEVIEQAAADSAEVVEAVEPPATPVIPPRLGLVRAEPDGSLVIAGSAAPGAEVEIYASGALLGSVTAESSGDWVFVPDAPLAAGGTEISIAVPETGLLAEQSVVVVVQDDLTTEPLVVASTPGQASQILQGLSSPSELEPVAVAEAPVEDESIAVAAINETPLVQLPVSPPLVRNDAAAAEVVAEVEDAATETATEVAAVAEADATAAVTETETETVEVALADPATIEEETPAVVIIPPTIDAIEVDGGRNFFAGSGAEGATVRLYVADQFVADTIVQDGRWLVETDENYLNDPSQRVRVDMLREESFEVAARAEVNFEIDLPEVETPAPIVVVEQAPAETPATEVAAVEDQDVQLEDPQLVLPDSPPIVAVAETESADVAATETMEVAEAEPVKEAEAVAKTEPATAVDAVAETEPVTEVEAVVEAEPVTEVATSLDTEVPAVEEEELPTLTAVQVGDAEDGRFASGKAIIRSGDNLWTIASRVYGTGVRFTTIYQANRQQIRDPNLIYPGQVFELPEAE